MIGAYSVTGIIVAAGSAVRFGSDKLLLPCGGIPVLFRAAQPFLNSDIVDNVIILAGTNIDEVEKLFADTKAEVVLGGNSRGETVLNGVMAATGEIIAVHDGARPFLSACLLQQLLNEMLYHRAVVPALPVSDTIKTSNGDGFVKETLLRNELYSVATPQIFFKSDYLDAAQKFAASLLTDDCSLLELYGIKVFLAKGEPENIKITTPCDMIFAEALARGGDMRIGQGYDAHRLVTGRRLVLGGVEIKNDKGLQGHSDADVLCHAIADALLGAAALGDIGTHFPDDDNEFLDISSIKLLSQVILFLRQAGYAPINIDSTVIAQEPKLAPFILQMRKNIAVACGLVIQDVSIKATTQEGMGFSGRKEGIAAGAVVTIKPLTAIS